MYPTNHPYSFWSRSMLEAPKNSSIVKVWTLHPRNAIKNAIKNVTIY